MPVVWVDVVAPAGPRLTTLPTQKLYQVTDAEFVVAANHFDTRTVGFKVVGRADGEQEVGVFDLPLGELVRQPVFIGKSQSVLGMKVLVEPATDLPVGGFAAMRPAQDPTNVSTGFSEPKVGAVAYRLTKIGGAIALGDYDNEFSLDGPPDLFLSLEQNGQRIFSSPTLRDSYDGKWTPSNVFIYAVPGDRFVVRSWDIDVQQDDPVIVGEFSSDGLAKGDVSFQTSRHSWARLTVEPVR